MTIIIIGQTNPFKLRRRPHMLSAIMVALHNWKSAQVVNCHLVCDPTIRQPCFDLPRQQWSLLNRFCTLRMKTLFHGWPIMAHETHTRRRRRWLHIFLFNSGKAFACIWVFLFCECSSVNYKVSWLQSSYNIITVNDELQEWIHWEASHKET